MRIGELAERGGVNIQTIRYYERRGLLKAPVRRGGRVPAAVGDGPAGGDVSGAQSRGEARESAEHRLLGNERPASAVTLLRYPVPGGQPCWRSRVRSGLRSTHSSMGTCTWVPSGATYR